MEFYRTAYFLLLLTFTIADDVRKSYAGYRLLRVNPENEKQLYALNVLNDNAVNYQLDFWQPPSAIGSPIDVLIPPLSYDMIVKDFEYRNISHSTIVEDLQKEIENERHPPLSFHQYAKSVTFDYDKYHSIDEIHKELRRLKALHPEMISLIDIGRSVENRPLLVVKISGKSTPPSGKKSFWLDAGIHAREWIAPATAMYIVRELVNGYTINDRITQTLLNRIDFYILPVVNPDGYEYSRNTDRIWRKSRRNATYKYVNGKRLTCGGVDLNRNFDWNWGQMGVSKDMCSDIYPGTYPFSEPETRAIRDFLSRNKPQAFISLHSYGQYWFVPFGHKRKTYPNDYQSKLVPLAQKAAKALQFRYGTTYQVGTSADLMWEASGISPDWAKGVLGVPIAYIVELRPTFTKNQGFNGFLVPEREIREIGLETFDAIKVVANAVAS